MLVDNKNDEVKIDIIAKTNEKYLSVSYGWIRFIDTYRFLSSNSDKLVETLFDISHKSLKKLEKKEIVGDDILINIVNEREKLFAKDENNRTIGDLRKYTADEIEKLEEALIKYMGENDLEIFKQEFLD